MPGLAVQLQTRSSRPWISRSALGGGGGPGRGRVLIAVRTATFEQLGNAIDDAFARWDHNHLHKFTLADGTLIIPARWWDAEEPEGCPEPRLEAWHGLFCYWT